MKAKVSRLRAALCLSLPQAYPIGRRQQSLLYLGRVELSDWPLSTGGAGIKNDAVRKSAKGRLNASK